MAKKVEERLRKINSRLYARNIEARKPKRAQFSRNISDVRTDWTESDKKWKRRLSGLQLLLILSMVFFVIAVAVSIFSFRSGRNVVSPDNIEIIVKGPASLKGGEEATLQIEITNKNAVAIESVDLTIAYPSGTRAADDITKETLRYRNYLDTINAGQTVKETVRAILFGDENEEKTIGIRLEYRTRGSSAIFPVEREYNIVISSAPVAVTLSVPEETNSGKEISIEAVVTSNSSQTLENIYLEIITPDGFSLTSSEPASIFGKNLWSLGDLPSGISRTVKLRGLLEGDENDSKQFLALAGIRRNENDRGVSIPYNSDEGVVFLRPAFIGLDLSLNGSKLDEVVVPAGSGVRGQVSWSNQLPSEVRDGQLVVSFKGVTLNQSKVSARSGFYQSADNTITWKPQDLPALSSLAPGASSRVDFDFSLIDRRAIELAEITNPTLQVASLFSGIRTSSGFEGQSIQALAETLVKIESDLEILAQGSYTSGPFQNIGPVPPRVGQETTYTITWSVTDTYNDLGNVVVIGTLPTYVTWLGVVSDNNQDISYNSANGQVTWRVGELRAGVGKRYPTRELSFQVSITPSLGQFDEALDLLEETSVSGTDKFTETSLSGTSRAVNTNEIIGYAGLGRVTN